MKGNFENSCVLLDIKEKGKKRRLLRNLFRCKEGVKIGELDLDNCEITEKEYRKRRKNLSSDFLIETSQGRFFDGEESFEYLEGTKRKQKNLMLFCSHSCNPNTRMIYNKSLNCLEFYSIKEIGEFEIITIDFGKNGTSYNEEDIEIPFYEEGVKENRGIMNYYGDEEVLFNLRLEDGVIKNISTNFIPAGTILGQVIGRKMKNKKEIGEFMRKRKYIGGGNIKFIEYSRTKETIYVDYLNNKFNFIEEVESNKETNILLKRNKETGKFDIIAKKDILSGENLKANFVYRK